VWLVCRRGGVCELCSFLRCGLGVCLWLTIGERALGVSLTCRIQSSDGRNRFISRRLALVQAASAVR